MSSEKDGARKMKRINRHPPAKISRKLRDMPTFHAGGSSSQAESLLPTTADGAARPPSAHSHSGSVATNISSSAPFLPDSNQRTLPLFKDLPNFTLEDPSQTYFNSFTQLWPQYISSNDVKHIENSDPTDIMLSNSFQLFCAIQATRKKIKNLLLERNALLESDQASQRRIVELKKSLNEQRAYAAQLKADYDSLKAQSQAHIQHLSSSLDQLNRQISTAKTSVIEEYKNSAEFANLIDEEFLKGAAKVKTMMENHYPQLDYTFLEDDEDGD